MNREELPKDMIYCCRNKLGACYNCFYQEIWYLKYIIYFFTVGQKTVQRHASTTKNFLSPRKNMFYPYKIL